MNRWRLIMAALVGISTAAVAEGSSLGAKIESFSAKDFRGKEHSLADYKDAQIVVLAFVGCECPLAKVYGPRLNELAEKYKDKGVVFLGVNSNRQDSVTEIASFARTQGHTFPILKDLGNQLADKVGAVRTPEVFVLDKDRVVRYAGRIDDQYGLTTTGGYAKPKKTRADLATAIDELLAGKPVSVAETKTAGCLIGKIREAKSDSPVTYSKQIARIFQKQCVECHRAGEIAPFSLETYDEVVGWAEMINEVVRDQRMPPWHADPKIGHWSNEKRLTADEKKLVADWVAAGAPEGNPSDLPPAKEFMKGWAIPQPDKVIWITDEPVKIPAEGTVEYKYFTVDPGFKEDVWVKMADCRPGTASVVHHIIAFVSEPGNNPKFTGNEPVNVYLLHGYAPGMPALIMPEGMAMHVPAGSKIVFQMHYTPNGTATEDKSCLGLVFADPKDVKHNARTDNALNPYLVIPPGASNHKVESFQRFNRDALLLTLMPHMHLRGKSFKYDLEYPDGTKETILDVPHYDFNWQNVYYFAEPKRVPAGSKLHCTAHYDNSEDNLANPNPKETVRWGDQTWEEMMIGWFTVTTDLDPSISQEVPRAARFAKHSAEEIDKIKAKTQRGFKRALGSPGAFTTYSRGLCGLLPMIDRMDVSTVDGEQVKFLQVYQTPVFNYSLGRAEKTFPAEGSALARAARANESIVNDDLAGSNASDLKVMAQALRSSLHVPVVVDGKPTVVSFWSKDPGAFGEPAKSILEGVARQLGGK